MRFLVVDDSRAMQSIIKRSLRSIVSKSSEIKTAADGEQALDVVREWKPDLVLTDWHMPIMGGLELMDKIQREMLNIKIGFITTETSETRIAAAKEAGALFVIQKPFDPEDLKKALDPILEDIENLKNSPPPKPDTEQTNGASQIILPDSSHFAEIVNDLTQEDILVESVNAIALNKKRLPCLVGLFNDGQSAAVRAVCVLELQAACVLGAAIAGLSGTVVRDAIANGKIEGRVFDGCELLLKVLSSNIYESGGQVGLQVLSMNVVPKIFPKLESIYASSKNRRSDFEIAVLDLGEGLVTIIAA